MFLSLSLSLPLLRLNIHDIAAIEEVNLFKDDGESVIHFQVPTVKANLQANTYVISGTAEEKKIRDMPDIINQLSPDNLEALKDIFANQTAVGGSDDDVPQLVDNFDTVDSDDDVPDLVA
jgi:nascent polypeptide-associated complex subunit beta